MAQALAYWHIHALGFELVAYAGPETGRPGFSSYLLKSNQIKLLISSVYPTNEGILQGEVAQFLALNHCGAKRIVLAVDMVDGRLQLMVEYRL